MVLIHNHKHTVLASGHLKRRHLQLTDYSLENDLFTVLSQTVQFFYICYKNISPVVERLLEISQKK